MRLIHLRKLKPSGWVHLGASARCKSSIIGSTSFTQNWVVDWKDVHPLDENNIGPLRIASFDIEADSSHGDFPVAKKDYRKLAMNMYEEYKRCKKNKIRINLSIVKLWIKAAFREYLPDEHFSQDVQSSIQTIILKKFCKLSEKEYDFVSSQCYKILVKSFTEKNKEVVTSLTHILNSSLPPVVGDKVIQIGTVLYTYGNEKKSMYRHIVTLKGCDPIPNVEVVSCSSVKQLIKEWVKFIAKSQPNVITGYNIFGFDFKFLWECAEEWGCLNYLQEMGPLKFKQTQLIEKELVSAAMGQNFLYYFDMPGIVTIDLLKVIQRDHNLSSYKLDDVSNQFINGYVSKIEQNCDSVTLYTKTTFSLQVGHYIALYKSSIIGKEYIGSRRRIKSLIENESICLELNGEENDDNLPEEPKSYYWAVGKDNVSPKDIFEKQRGSDTDRAIVAKYCVQDCELCLNLLQKLELIANNIGMSNVCLVPFAYLFMRGQMIKTLSLVSSECLKEHYLIPELPRKEDNNVKESYEGAEVLEPKPAIFLDDPVSVLDYSSLYPSSMIGTNISHDTIIQDDKYLGESGAALLKSKNISFQDVTYDNYITKMVGKTAKKSIHPTEPTVTCRYVQPPVDSETGEIIDSKRGILPKILMKLLQARKDTRAQIKNEKDAFRRSVLDGLQLAYKVTANSLYGGVGAGVSALYYKDIAASTTATGRKYLHMAKDYVNKHFPKAEVVYGDSVVADTPLLLRLNKQRICIMTIHELFDTFSFSNENGNNDKRYVSVENYETWTESGWTCVNRVMRHEVSKKIYRIVTHCSCVDVTEDHSLLNVRGEEVSPKEVCVGDDLMLSFPNINEFYDLSDTGDTFDMQTILNGSICMKIEHLKKIAAKHGKEFTEKDGSMCVENKVYACFIYSLLVSLNYNVYIDVDVGDVYTLTYTFKKRVSENSIVKIIDLGVTNQCVYDLTTTNHHFHAGVGRGIVHNTDSIFVNFKPTSSDGTKLYGKDALKASIEMSESVEKGIQCMLEKPHKLEYEKTFYPFILLRKKGYIGNKYEFDLDKYKQTSMGVVTKRRDNAPIVKYVYDGIIKRIINDKDIEASITFLKECIDKVLNGEFPMSYFIVTKSLKAEYANPEQIVHKVLADRMGERDPGNKPQSNDRIPYAYVKTKNVPKLQGERVEHPDYIVENNLKLDYLFYIEHQIQKPVCQVYALALDALRAHGYKLCVDHFDKHEKQLKQQKVEKSVIREKIMELKSKEAYNVLFKKRVKIEEGKRYGQRHISDFFK